jgi:hypothetical protein
MASKDKNFLQIKSYSKDVLLVNKKNYFQGLGRKGLGGKFWKKFHRRRKFVNRRLNRIPMVQI